jgi:hypothetical protein
MFSLWLVLVCLDLSCSSRILYLGTSSSRIALASIHMSNLGRRSPCCRYCQLAGPPFGPLALLCLENHLTSRQSPAPLCQREFSIPCGTFQLAHVHKVRGSTVKNDHLAIMGNMKLPWGVSKLCQNSFYGRIASNVRFVCTLVQLSSAVER